jgi:hypothetical protein
MTLIGILVILFIINIFITTNSSSILESKLGEVKEANKPVKIELSIIDCSDCSDTSSIIESIKTQNVEILNENTYEQDSSEAKELILKYNIQKLPSVIISGEIKNNKTHFNDFELLDDSLVLNKIDSPYLDLVANEIKGKVELIEITDSSCEKCVSLETIPLSLGESGVLISDWKKVEYNSKEGKEFINKFEVKQIPAILISDDIDYYDNIKQSLSQLGLENKQGFYALHSTSPPYRNLSNNKIIGLADLVMLIDETCTDCYDVTINKQILQNLGVIINNENTYDVSSSDGQQLISKYNITKIPIIVLSKEANFYPLFVNAWTQVGTVEDDGWFVMRQPEGLGNTKTLE